MLGAMDTSLPGATFYRRNVIFGNLNWWNVEDLRAEIRESTSNNRVKSGYEDRPVAPIDKVPDAGAVAVSAVLIPARVVDQSQGLPNALDADPYLDQAVEFSSPYKGKQPVKSALRA